MATPVETFWPLLRRLMKVHTVAYRATGGHIGHRFPGSPPNLLLDHVGAKSGTKRTSALSYIRDGDDIVIVASKGGHPKNPAWFHNLRANPDTTIQVGSKHLDGSRARGQSRGAEAAVAEGRRRVQRLRGLPEADRAGDPARGPRTAGRVGRGSAMQRAQPPGRVLPAPRGRGHPHAHRFGGHPGGAASVLRSGRADGAGAPAERPALPAEGPLPPARARPAGLGGRPALQPRLPPAAHGPARARRRRGAAQPRGAGHVAAARPLEAAVGDLDDRAPDAAAAGRC